MVVNKSSPLPVMPYTVDAQFFTLLNQVGEKTTQEIVDHMAAGFQKLEPQTQRVLEDYMQKYAYWGSLRVSQQDYTLFQNRAEALRKHQEDFIWLYHCFRDYRSKFALLKILSNWYNFESLEPIKERLYSDYFDLDIMQCGPKEVLVDLGAYLGWTATNYIRTYGLRNYSRMYCYEITANTFQILQNNLKPYPNIVFRQKGASDQPGLLYLNENQDASANSLHAEGDTAIPTVTIDADIEESVTFIKMDIEGSEQRALRGCTEKIKTHKPKLAISVYHNNEDIWKIPRMIEEICPGYQFYLRYHGGALVPTEITLLAVHTDTENTSTDTKNTSTEEPVSS